MKKFITLLTIIINLQLFAQNQVNVNVVIPPPFTPFLSDYTQFGGQNVITLTNTTSNVLQIKLVGSVTGEDNGLFLFTKSSYTPPAPIVLAPFQTYTVTASSPSKDFLTEANTESNLSQQQRDVILASGVLPEGTYKLCVRAVDYFSNQPYSDPDLGCSFIFINFPLPPILLNPICHSEVQNPFPSFNWTPVIASGSFIMYDLYILRLLPTQIPDDAMWLAVASNVGNPIKISNLVAPVYQYKPYDLPLVPGQTYAWCVVARDISNQIVLANQGRSEVCTFTYNPPSPPQVNDPPVTQSGGGVLPGFSLNNTSVSGKILYRYYNNENFGDPGNPAYNPSITVHDEPKNAQELALMLGFSQNSGNMVQNNAQNLGGQAASGNLGLIQTVGYQNLVGQMPSTTTNSMFKGKIEIDPSKKYLYENTLSIAGADPLRKTSVSLYLEYVALKRTEGSNSTYFQIIPADQAVMMRTDIAKHSGHYDPQLKVVQVPNYFSGGTKYEYSRPTGSELLATAITDNDGNFTFNFDLTENTGLLAKGPITLKYYKLNNPNINESNVFVHPLDMIHNPVQNIMNPAQDITNQFNQVVNGGSVNVFGNTQLQGNQGWGNQTNLLNSPAGNTPNLNKNLNKGVKGPAGEIIYFPDNVDIIEWMSYSVNHLFKVLRIRVNDPYFCHPDILIFAQPGDQLSLPPVVSFVNSFNLELNLKAGGLVADDPILAPGEPISNFSVRLGRQKSFWQSRPENFPLHEGMDLQPESYFQINSTTPHFHSSPTANKSGEFKFTSFDVSKSDGKVLFKNLVKSKQSITHDTHYFEVEFPLTTTYNYTGSWGTYRMLTNAFQFGNELQPPVPHSYNFKPDKAEVTVKLEPRKPELLLRTVVQSNIERSPLAGVQAYLLEYNRNNNQNTFSYANFRLLYTDENGYAPFENLSQSFNPAGGLENPYRRVMLVKNGYRTEYRPTNVANPGNVQSNYLQPAKKGQRQNLNEILMEGNATVSGFVKDEFDNPVLALIKIGDGPFQMTNMSTISTGYNNPVLSNGEDLPPSPEMNPSQVFGMFDAGMFAGQLLSPSGGTSSGQGFGTFNINQISAPTVNVGGFLPSNDVTITMSNLNYSRFVMNAPATGGNTRVIVIPMSDQYFPDTFYVNIQPSQQIVNIGTFKVYEKAHRVQINVTRNANAIADLPSVNAIVQVGEHTTQTNNQGSANFRFTTPDSYFRVFIKDGNFVPIEVYRHLPISKKYVVWNYSVEQGRAVSGTVKDASTQEPIAGARVFAQTGTTQYGQTLVQTFTNAQGYYELQGVPMNQVQIHATKSGANPSYLGTIQSLNIQQSGSAVIHFELERFADLNIAKIFGFDVELIAAAKSGNEWICQGAFVQLKESGNFKPYDPNTRVRFYGLRVKASQQNDANGIPFAEPVNNELITMENMVRFRLFNSFLVDLRSDRPSGILHKIVVEKRDNLQGAFRGRLLTDLESFRFSFNYAGEFYISDNTSTVSWAPYQSVSTTLQPTKYIVMNRGVGNAANDISFNIHNFNAKADRESSFIDKDKVNLKTFIYPQLQLAGNVEVDAGNIIVTPAGISISNQGHQITFNLEQWGIRSTNGWNYSIPHGGIVIPKARITTKMVEIPVNDLILRPNQLIMPGTGVELNNLMLGGGTTKLHQYPNTTALLNFDPACSYDLGPHWRFTIVRTPSSQPACYIQGLKGFSASDKIDIGAFTIFSNNSSLVQPINQIKRFHNIVDFDIQNIENGPDAVDIVGALYTGIPGVTPPTMVVEYKKSGNSHNRRVKSIDLVLETPGKIFFNGYVGNEHYKLEDNYFEANGAMVFENDDPNDGKNIPLVGRLIKTPSQTRLMIPKLKNDNTDAAFQYINMAEGGGRLKVINGEQRVMGGQWNVMSYTADLITPNTTDGLQSRRLDYEVNGAVEVKKSGSNAVKIDKIDTPLGNMQIVFDWEKAMFLGTLQLNVPINMSVIQIQDGLFEIMFSGQGFYFDLMGKVQIPAIGELFSVNVGFLTGYCPKLPQQVIKRHEDIMFLIGVPDYLKTDGIKGVYINANASPEIFNWSVSVPLPLFSVGFGVGAGVDFSFLLHFGTAQSVLNIQAAAYAKAYAGVQVLACTFCVGAMAQFMVDGTFQFAPSVQATLNGCGSFSMMGSFCGVEASKDIACTVRANSATNSKLDIGLQWSSCSGPSTTKNEIDCDF
ncbi:MAG: carboxypeptidase regulatory-like domain-containing protein [Flavobacteriales bacterium]